MVTRSDAIFRRTSGLEPAGFAPGRTPEEGASFSGHERDHLFLNLGAGRFEEVSGISGTDDPGDSRGAALLDFDRDGFLDIAGINANAPSLMLFHNRLGADPQHRAIRRFVALRFVGANRRAEAAPGRSNRDGFGAVVTIELEGRKLVRQHRAGEGFATQNSATMLVGIGPADVVRAISVRWPSGRIQRIKRVPANRLVTVREPDDVLAGVPFELASYAPLAPITLPPAPDRASTLLAVPIPPDAGDPELRVFTTFASWCEACRSDLPQFVRLREVFSPARVGLFSVPADEDDDRTKLEQWMTEKRPPYRMLFELPPPKLAEMKRLLAKRLRLDALPSTVVTDRDGEVLLVTAGVPTVSDLRRLEDGSAPSPSVIPASGDGTLPGGLGTVSTGSSGSSG